MIALIQRVCEANVVVDGHSVGSIGNGLLVLLGVEKDDDEKKAHRLHEKVLGYRIFNDENHKMNLNVKQTAGSLLVVSQFTLTALTNNGMRPSFNGASPELADNLYQVFCQYCRKSGINTENGIFGANMKVSLVNDGPVTFWLQV